MNGIEYYEDNAYSSGNASSIDHRVDSLQNSNLNFPSKWRELKHELVDWYNENIKPLLKDELKMFNKYAKNTNN